MRNYTGVWQGTRGPLTAPAGGWMDLWCIKHADDLYLWCRTAGAWSGTCSLFTQSHSEGKQIFGLGIFVCGCTQGDKAGWKIELFCVFPRAVILYLQWPEVGTFYGKWYLAAGKRLQVGRSQTSFWCVNPPVLTQNVIFVLQTPPVALSFIEI